MDQTITVSPFSVQKEYHLKWGKPGQKSIPKNIQLNDVQIQTLKRLEVLKYATKVQMAKQLNLNLRRGKQTVDYLQENNVLVQHLLQDKTKGAVIPFYSVSDEAASRWSIETVPKYDIQQILKQLLLSQFYVRFKELDNTTEVLPFPSPFDGAFSLLGLDFRVAIIRRSAHAILKHFLYNNEQMRTLLVVERMEEASELLPLSNGFFRVTMDYHLLKSDLSTSFYRAYQGEWVQEVIPVFQTSKMIKTLE